MNRDERRVRPLAVPPRALDVGGVRAVMPLDPAGGGTWVAATDAGLVFALLNGDGVPRPRRVTRGAIIPSLIGCCSLDALEIGVRAIDVGRHAPFHLVATDGAGLLDVESDGRRRRQVRRPLASREVFTSSSLLPAMARARRTALFHELVTAPSPLTQDAYHDHAFADAPHLGVLMEREDARTVSRTVVSLHAGRVVVRYQPLPAGTPVEIELDVSRARAPARPPLDRPS